MGHFHVGHVHLHAHGGPLHRLNGFSIAAFLCWFGGIGYLLQHSHGVTATVAVFFALSAGCVAASLISAFLTKVLLRYERPLLPEDTEMRGVLARVSNRVRPGGTGEIIFSLNGTRRCAAARSHFDGTLQRGEEVVVTEYTRGIAWITPFPAVANVGPEIVGSSQQHTA
jgi:hypothetical protein